MRLFRLKDLSMHPKKTIDVELAELRLGVSILHLLSPSKVVAFIQTISNLLY